jgi:ubiquinone/menaquinone biosynthesis C-methylase UbiE
MAINRRAWDAYSPAYMDFALKSRPDFFEFFAGGGVCLNEWETRLAGDVTGLTVLDVCCASFADEAFSWENLGADVIACDISPVAIEIAQRNGARLGSRVRFVVADSQELEPIESESVDLVYGRYVVWFEDIDKTMRTWHRVTKPGGRLLVATQHPIMDCLEQEAGAYKPIRRYDDESHAYERFTGTPLADSLGGWGQEYESVEFFHPTWRIMNAVLDAGFRIRHVEEPVGAADMPHTLVVLADKE